MYAEIVIEGKWLDVVIDRAIPGRMPSPRPDLRKMNMAMGPVIVFAASNFRWLTLLQEVTPPLRWQLVAR